MANIEAYDLTADEWTLISSAPGQTTFQNVGQNGIYINFSGDANTTPAESVGLVYKPFSGESQKAFSDLTYNPNATFMFAKAISGASKVLVNAWSPLFLFSNSEAGAWYDPSDLTTMFQDYSGTAAAVDSPVKLILDKSQGELHSLGSELVTNGTFDSGSNWIVGGDWSISDGKAQITSWSTNSEIQQSGISNNSGERYRVQATVTTVTAGTLEVYHIGLGAGVIFDTSTDGMKTVFVRAGGSNSTISIRARGGWEGSIDNVSIKKVPGNHAYQDTDSKRPMLRQSGGLYYLEFDGVDDYLLAGVSYSSDIVSVYAALTLPNDNDFYLDGDSTNTMSMGRETGKHRMRVGSNQFNTTGNIPSGAFVTTSVFRSGSNNTINRMNRVEESGTTDAVTTSEITIGATGLPSGYLAGKIYGLIVRGADPNQQEIISAENWLASKSGVSL